MRYHVAQLLRELVGVTREYAVDEPARVLEADVVASAPIRGRVRLLRTGRGVLASATLRTRLRLTCSRCLEDVDEDVRLTFDEEFRPSIDLATGQPLPAPGPEGECSVIDEQHILDLTDVVRQNALLAMPMKPLCEEACPGLCAQCGRRRDGSCRCREPEPEAAVPGPLASALRAWLTEHGEGR